MTAASQPAVPCRRRELSHSISAILETALGHQGPHLCCCRAEHVILLPVLSSAIQKGSIADPMGLIVCPQVKGMGTATIAQIDAI